MVEEPKPRKRLRAPERQVLILEAAGRLFGERGFDATRLDDVAAAAGVTKPVLYRHFDGKAALYLAVLERHRRDLDGFAAAIPAAGTLEERLRAVLDVWLRYVDSHAYAWRMVFRDHGGGPGIEAFRHDVHARARAVLAGLIDALAERPIAARELDPLAEMLSMGMASLVLWWLDEPATPRAAILDAMTRVWTGLLAPAA